MASFCVISFSGNTSYFALMIGLSFSILQYITSSFCFPQRFYKTLLYFSFVFAELKIFLFVDLNTMLDICRNKNQV